MRWFALGLAALLAACGPQKAKEAARPVLHAGDQLFQLQATLSAAGEGKPAGYAIQWANFIGGPPLIAAQTGGSVDVGWMMETPLVFAQAAGSPVKVVAVGRMADPKASAFALVTSPNSRIRSVADLRGRSVGFMPGTITQYFLARLLAQAGLPMSAIHEVHLNGPSADLLGRGTLDALVTTDPYLTQLLDQGKVRVLARGGEPLMSEMRYLVVSKAALNDPARAALIGDFVERVVRATRWQTEHPAAAAPTFAKVDNVTPAIAEAVLRRSPVRFAPIDQTVIDDQQREADFFHKLGLTTAVDASKLYDHRYDARVIQAEKGS